jgi:nucleoside 2-deoxyribosyltransferase
MRVYMSGSMASRFAQEVQAERAEASSMLAKIGVRAVDPAAAESQLWGKHVKAKISTKFRYKIIEAMVKKDLWLIRRCDLVLVLTGDIVSDGTWEEWLYAQSIGVPVIMIAPKRYKGELNGWANVTIQHGNIVPSLKAACNLIKRKYLKEEEQFKAYFNAAIKNADKRIKDNKRKKH